VSVLYYGDEAMTAPRYRLYHAGYVTEYQRRRDAIREALAINQKPGTVSWDGTANVWDTLTERWIA
jgi:hypothetical protein